METLGLHNLKPPQGAHKKKKILGRGSGSGHGKTSTRGHKGQTSRAGHHFYPGFEGYQSPLIRRIPKRGFKSRKRKGYQIINLQQLNKLTNDILSAQTLQECGLISDKNRPVKVLGKGTLNRPIKVEAAAFSKSAREKIEEAGGKCFLL